MSIKLKLNKEQEAKLEELLQARLNLIQDNIATVVQKEIIPHFIDLIMERYDELGERMDTLPHEDPTNPANWREVFKAKLEQEAEQTFFYDRESGRIKVHLGEKSYLGYGEEPNTSDNTPLIWMVYYLEGLVGSWGWITRDVWQQVYPTGVWDTRWGRFKNAPGFMVSGGDFFKRTDRQGNPNLLREHITWSEIRHPFSAFSPKNIFAEAVDELQVRPFISKAITASIAGKKL